MFSGCWFEAHQDGFHHNFTVGETVGYNEIACQSTSEASQVGKEARFLNG
jgi:hypothetical protein